MYITLDSETIHACVGSNPSYSLPFNITMHDIIVWLTIDLQYQVHNQSDCSIHYVNPGADPEIKFCKMGWIKLYWSMMGGWLATAHHACQRNKWRWVASHAPISPSLDQPQKSHVLFSAFRICFADTKACYGKLCVSSKTMHMTACCCFCYSDYCYFNNMMFRKIWYYIPATCIQVVMWMECSPWASYNYAWLSSILFLPESFRWSSYSRVYD